MVDLAKSFTSDYAGVCKGLESMYPFRSALVAVLALTLPVSAQEIRFELVDTGVLDHSSHGRGIEMRFKPDPMPDGFFDIENLADLMDGLCSHYAPSVIPFVQEQTDIEDPEFIAVRLISGGRVIGRYVLRAYAISDGGCGEQL